MSTHVRRELAEAGIGCTDGRQGRILAQADSAHGASDPDVRTRRIGQVNSRAARDEYREVLAPFGVTPVMPYVKTPRNILVSQLENRVDDGSNDIHVLLAEVLAFVDDFQVSTSAEVPVRVVSSNAEYRER